jgi:valyl-tRNA synthetase
MGLKKKQKVPLSLPLPYRPQETLTPSKAYVHAKDAEIYSTTSAQKASISTLIKGLESLEIAGASDPIPDGCGGFVISEACTVYLLVKGRVNVDAEIEKTKKKIAKAVESRKRLEKARAVPDYKNKVKAEVQEADRVRLGEFSAEERTWEELVVKGEGLRA